MSDQKSYLTLAFRRLGDERMSAAIADELHAIVTRAAQPIRPGESIKVQMNRAWLNLARPPMWRLKSAWWRDGSGHWSAAAVKDFQARYQAFREREARRAIQSSIMENAQRSIEATAQVEAARDDYQALVRRIEAVEAALRVRG